MWDKRSIKKKSNWHDLERESTWGAAIAWENPNPENLSESWTHSTLLPMLIVSVVSPIASPPSSLYCHFCSWLFCFVGKKTLWTVGLRKMSKFGPPVSSGCGLNLVFLMDNTIRAQLNSPLLFYGRTPCDVEVQCCNGPIWIIICEIWLNKCFSLIIINFIMYA